MVKNRALVLPAVAAFLVMSASALAEEDMKPLSEMTGSEVLAARKAAKEYLSRMTPEEQTVLANTPLSEMTGQQVLAARQVAGERWYRMTPEERVAARETAHGKKDAERTAMDEYVAALEKRAPQLTLKVCPQDCLTPEQKKKAERAEKALAEWRRQNDQSRKAPGQ